MPASPSLAIGSCFTARMIVERSLRQRVSKVDAVFVLGQIDIRHRVVDHDLSHEIAQRALNVSTALAALRIDRPAVP